MDGLLPFFVPACCLWFSVTGAWMVFSTLRSGSGIAPAGEPTSESSAAVRAKVRTRLRNARIGGVFWLCFGIATVWFTEFRAPWILPSVGLFWAVIGAGALISTFRPSRQSAIAKKVHEELAAASNVNARGQLRRQQLAGGIFLLALGLPVLCFSGIRVGASPAAVSQPPEQYSRVAEIVTRQVEREFAKQGHVGLVVGAIRSTGRDMITFLKANMGMDSTPIDATIQRSHEELGQPHANRAGMNWIRSFDREILKTVVWHNGGTGGFSSYLGFTEDRQYGVFVLANTSGRVDELAEGILEALVREYAPGSRKAGRPLRSRVEPP
jgi:hypothetical protein